MDDSRPDPYRKPYLIALNGITDAVRAIKAQNYGEALDILVRAQQKAEEAYIV